MTLDKRVLEKLSREENAEDYIALYKKLDLAVAEDVKIDYCCDGFEISREPDENGVRVEAVLMADLTDSPSAYINLYTNFDSEKSNNIFEAKNRIRLAGEKLEDFCDDYSMRCMGQDFEIYTSDEIIRFDYYLPVPVNDEDYFMKILEGLGFLKGESENNSSEKNVVDGREPITVERWYRETLEKYGLQAEFLDPISSGICYHNVKTVCTINHPELILHLKFYHTNECSVEGESEFWTLLYAGIHKDLIINQKNKNPGFLEESEEYDVLLDQARKQRVANAQGVDLIRLLNLEMDHEGNYDIGRFDAVDPSDTKKLEEQFLKPLSLYLKKQELLK